MSRRLPSILVLLVAGSVSAQSFPDAAKPVKFIVPFAAGSATDSVGRLLARGLQERIKGVFIVENKPGSNGTIAADFVAKSPADGYTLFMATVSTHSQNPWMMKKIPYDPIKGWAPIAGVGGFPFAIVTGMNVPANSFADFIAYAMANPGKLSYGAPGGTAAICVETLKLKTGIDLVQVPYKSSPQAIGELIAGQIALICSDFATAIGSIKGDRIRALAVTTDKRSAQLPEVPALKESIPDFVEMRSWIGILAPAGTPREVVELLEKEILAVTATKDFAAKLEIFGFERLPLSAAQLGDFMQAELAKWGQLVRQSGIEPQ